jgi:putative transcriptional regulator
MTDPDESLAGRLLVASPGLADTNFDHAVVLLLDHNADGALGVVLNNPSDVPVSQALPDWQVLAASPAQVFIGGPVQQEALVALAPLAGELPGTEPVVPGIAIVDLEGDPVVLAAEIEHVRLFVGYAGWGGGQLEAEIDAGGWFVVDSDPADPFSDEPAALWREVLQRQGGIFRTVPENPSLN